MKPNIGQGDTGKTSLLGGKEKCNKDIPQVEAYGTIDELNSLVGFIRSHELSKKIDRALARVQDDLFRAESHVSTAPGFENFPHLSVFDKKRVAYLEEQIQKWEKSFAAPEHFVLPGGTREAALCDMARTLSRRAERRLVTWMRDVPETPARHEIYRYINRLSDFFFTLELYLNHEAGKSQPTWVGREKRN
ncbi:MAG: cob(I)yrinic acid a,c-diamide adenosyltransferase [Candidatus Spechtbacteria bacterium]|nr:cob(I)yrinic acid a,c-diamide adenosyltransferase [Candidatus Spechtbacteria bacterium]